MSFLLDALRKSELERRVGEAPKLTLELPLQSAQQKRHPFIVLVIVLVLINIGAFLYITMLDRAGSENAKDNPPQSVAPRSTPAPVEKTAPNATSDISAKMDIPAELRSDAKPMVSLDNPSRAKQAEHSLAGRNQTDHQPAKLAPTPKAPPAIPENRAIKKVEKIVEAPRPTEPKQNPKIVEQKPQLNKFARNLFSKPAQLSKVEKASVNPEKPERVVEVNSRLENAVTVAKRPPPDTPAKPAGDAIPLLSAMPRDFQREVPSLNINVFVYSDVPEQRFVIVNMDKYLSGQKVDNGPEILEIRSDSLVLNYLGKKFRIKRP